MSSQIKNYKSYKNPSPQKSGRDFHTGNHEKDFKINISEMFKDKRRNSFTSKNQDNLKKREKVYF